MAVVPHLAVVGGLFPQNLAGPGVHGEDFQRVLEIDVGRVGMEVAGLAVEVEVHRRFLARHFGALQGRRQENTILPDHW